MKQKPNVILRLSLALVGCLVCFALIQYMETARESEAKTQLESIATVQQAFYMENKEYSKEVQSIGYSPSGRLRGQAFLSKENIPAEILSIIPKDSLPFVDKESFRALYVMKAGEHLQLFTIDEKKTYKKVSLQFRP